MAIAPPIYDPIAYYHKAKVVWDSIARGNFSGMLNGVKANRPPGSSLLLYPFGFKPSVRSFLFAPCSRDCLMDAGGGDCVASAAAGHPTPSLAGVWWWDWQRCRFFTTLSIATSLMGLPDIQQLGTH